MNSKNGSKTFRGSLTLEWYNKEKSIILLDEKDVKSVTDIPAPAINWVNKNESLFYEIDEQEGKGVKPYWVDRNDIRVKEPRPLIFKKTYVAEEKNKKNGEKDFTVKELDKDNEKIQNILIKGDNLLALNTLVKIFENKPDNEKVKCIYIDPPYNTGSALEYYDDNIEHSEWLALMRDRLILLRRLLRIDGVLIAQIDNKEFAYLKILLDEIFGKKNYVDFVTLETRTPSGYKIINPGFFNASEYLLIYAYDKSNFKHKTLYKEKEFEEHYNKFVENINDDPKEWIVANLKDIFLEKIKFKNWKEAEESFGYDALLDELRDFAVKNAKQIAALEFVGRKASKRIIEAKEESLKHRNRVHILENSDGKRTYLYNGREIVFYSKKFRDIDGEIVASTVMTNIWTDISWSGIGTEGNIEFKYSKKPEKLIKRLLDFATEKNDLVLDSFAGSGTTIAVAHKMERKWIGIEIGNHADTHIIHRMKKVLSGEDRVGVSEALNWQGGGSFKYYYLGESIISIDKDGQKDFNWNLSLDLIASGVLYYFDYRQLEDKNLLKGYSIGVQTNKDRNIIGMAKINKNGSFLIKEDELFEVLRYLKKTYKPIKTYLFTNCGVTCNDEEIPEDLGIVKVPQEILASIE